VHRDVKPANVLMAGGDHAYLTDFGLVKDLRLTAGHTRTGEVLGTLDYVAPERIRGEAVGPSSDVYALGCVLFFVLTARVVFPLDAPESKLWAHISQCSGGGGGGCGGGA
jgi:serine/threonine protein kinase